MNGGGRATRGEVVREDAARGGAARSAWGESGAVHDQSGAHRRAFPRCCVQVEVGLHSESNFYGGLSENLSVGGVFVATHAALPPVGTSVEVELHLPSSAQPLRVAGTVAWLRDSSPGGEGGPGMGIRFDDLAPPVRQAVRSFLSHREPLLYDDM